MSCLCEWNIELNRFWLTRLQTLILNTVFYVEYLKIFDKYYLKEKPCVWVFINPFPHTKILQQTLNIFCQNIENLYNRMDNLWLKVENIVAKGEIARFEQFLLLSLCFQKAVCSNSSESVYMRERVKCKCHNMIMYIL